MNIIRKIAVIVLGATIALGATNSQAFPKIPQDFVLEASSPTLSQIPTPTYEPSPSPTPTLAPTATPIVPTATPPKPTPHPTPAGPIDYKKTLKDLEYFKGETTDADLALRNAVIRFQSDVNLIVTGIWDNIATSNLKKRMVDTDFIYPDLIITPPTTAKWITINKTKRILTLYENRKVLKKYPVAIGNPPSLTPDGKLSIVCKVVNPTWGGGGYAKPVPGGSSSNPLGKRWMGLSKGGGSSYGIHGNASPYSIGKNVSHGCIRMINYDVEEIFDMVPNNTIVWIGSESMLAGWGVTQKDYLSSN